MQLALYRAERPETFEEIIGQKHIVRILQNQLKQGTVSQAYLFTGTHGTGKTSTARILAKALNCINAEEGKEGSPLPCGKCENCESIREGRYPDVIELDAASNNGVDDLRAIIDLVQYPPSVGKYKVYIIDEVHMLTQQAENAFLKTLEEPPEYAIFILATTDPQKVRATIKSRCMQLNFKRVTEAELIEGMQKICEKKHVKASKEALATIATKADGSVRDALSILEQCMAASEDQTKLSVEDVLEAVGAAGQDFYLKLTEAVNTRELGNALELIDDICREGKDPKQVMKDWLEHYRNLMILSYVKRPERIINASEENISRLKTQSETLSIKDIEKAIKLLSEYINIGRYSDRPRILLETAAVKLAWDDNTGESETKPRGTHEPKRNHETKATIPEQPKPKTQPEIKSQPEPKAKPDEKSQKALEIKEPAMPISDDADEMWACIVAEIAKNESSFGTIIGKNSYGESFEGDELTVIVKSNKLAIAQDSLDDIQRVAKNLYGARVFVTMRPGKVDRQQLAIEYDEPTEVIIDDDKEWDEFASDLGELLGVEVDVVDK